MPSPKAPRLIREVKGVLHGLRKDWKMYVVLLIALMASIAAWYVSYYYGAKSVNEILMKTEREMANRLRTNIDYLFTAQIQGAENARQQLTMQMFDIYDVVAIQKFCWTYFMAMPYAASVYIIVDNKLISFTRGLFDQNPINGYMMTLQWGEVTNYTLQSFAVYDAIYGSVNLTSPIYSYEGYQSEDYPLNVITKSTLKPAWSDIYGYFELADPFITYGLPSLFLNGSYCCSFFVDITLAFDNNPKITVKLDDGYVLVVDQNNGGIVVDSSNFTLNFTSADGFTPATPSPATHHPVGVLGQAASNILDRYGSYLNVPSNSTSIFSFDYGGSEQLLFMQSYTNANLDWLIVGIVPASDYTSLFEFSGKLSLAINCVSFALTIIYYLYMIVRRRVRRQVVVTPVTSDPFPTT